MKKTMQKMLTLTALLFLVAGCAASSHLKDVRDASDKDLTVGTVQKEIREGMSGAEVAAALGSPNIVSTDENGREVWIYDKISTEYVRSTSSGGLAGLIFGGIGGALGGVSKEAGASSVSQRTITVIVKFDDGGKVNDLAYHTSRF